MKRASVGTGRRPRLKIVWPYGREGSSPSSPTHKATLAYVIGVALGDGNLSNPNGRAVRLRVTCDTKYPNLIKRIVKAIHAIVPDNKVSIIHRKKTYIDISCYSNKWESILSWKAGRGSKILQKARVPNWINQKRKYKIACLKGLLETDGTVYTDRGYKMVMFANAIKELAKYVHNSIKSIGFEPKIYKISHKRDRSIYHVRVSKNVSEFLKLIQITKE